MHLSPLGPLGPLDVVRCGRRLLYVALFIVFLITFGRWGELTTYTFLASALCFIIPALFFLRDDGDQMP